MNIKEVLSKLISEKNIYTPEKRKEVLYESLKTLSKYLKENYNKIDYEEFSKIIKNYIEYLDKYHLLDTLDIYNIDNILDKEKMATHFDYNPENKALKISGNEKFFMNLSRIFHKVVRKHKFKDKVGISNGEKWIDFKISLKNKMKETTKEQKAIIENVIAVQFSSFIPKDQNITKNKLYTVNQIKEFNENNIDKYDFMKFSEGTKSDIWGISIIDDNKNNLFIVVDLYDEDINFITNKHLQQLNK